MLYNSYDAKEAMSTTFLTIYFSAIIESPNPKPETIERNRVSAIYSTITKPRIRNQEYCEELRANKTVASEQPLAKPDSLIMGLGKILAPNLHCIVTHVCDFSGNTSADGDFAKHVIHQSKDLLHGEMPNPSVRFSPCNFVSRFGGHVSVPSDS